MRRIDPGERWGDVIADSEATADAFRERDWTAIAAHPGDVNPVTDATRLDVLLPGSEFDAANEAVGDAAIDTVRVYAASADGVEYRLVVAEDADAAIAVCVPTYLGAAEFDALREAVGADGTLTVRLRPLDDRDVVEIEMTDPDVFFEPESDA
ncbi:hypothetical protein C461_14553 [Halorubrum aidingense JCM 13560]|uniref:Uncharacterized protein n=1 Tax=Halorubrum aidingense JCM 13560 TaxID=1230454 RepID=M0P914_9EURY|nr:hypothetical protein [Halorubrum aidingense]EMA65325.1 hypothetical protein C461_14553 [Halorubrum aidingense JCM 13560]